MQQQVGMTFFGDEHGLYRRTVPQFPFVDGELRFANSETADDDWLVFLLPNVDPFSTLVPRERRILVLGEPSPMHTISAAYANQFGILVSPYMVAGFDGNWFPSHPGLPWFFATRRSTEQSLSFDKLVGMPVPEKLNEVSVIVSNKVFHEGHRVRLRFVEYLRERLGSRLHVFGRGIREIDDKADAILPYAYHLSLENTIEPNYWSEKLSDTYLGYAFPLYAGCTNINDWFPAESMQRIDLDCFERAAADVIGALDADNYQNRLPSIRAARDITLYNETVFNVLSRAIEAFPSDAQRLSRPEPIGAMRKTLMTQISRKSRRLFHKVTFRKAQGLT